MTQKIFPKDFLWGVSTSSHQAEGGTYNQWSVWELAHAQELASTAKQRLGWIPSWDRIKAQAERADNYVSGAGVDHYKKYKEDFRIVKQLNMNSFRFGIEWSRLQPQEGTWDQTAVDHYHTYIKELKSQGIEPIMNLWHWTVPVWFDAMGGFKKHENLKYWQQFVQRVVREYGSELKYILTLNETNVYSSFSYLTGEWPPQEKNILSFIKVYWNLTRAHKIAYAEIKALYPGIQVGMAAHLTNIQAKRPHNYIDISVTRWMRYFWNWWFLNRIRKQQDFIGFNYYFTDYYKGPKPVNPKLPLSDLGWYMEPEGIYPLLIRVWTRYKKPIMITENGVADTDDQYRRWWIEETIVAMERAMSEGVDVIGYMHWSLLDNFEWKYGWWPKFGLVEVDREHGMKRIIRPSAQWFADKIKTL